MKNIYILTVFLLFCNLQGLEAQSVNELKNIAQTEHDFNKRIEALNKISDQQVLHEIFENSNDPYFKGFVVRNITDTLILREIALSEKSMSLYAVLGKIKDQDIIKKALANNAHTLFIDSIMCFITDEAFKEELATNPNTGDFLRHSAIKYCKSQEVKKKLAIDKQLDEYFRIAAINTVTNQYLLYSLLINEESNGIKKAAVEALSRPDFVEDIAKNESVFNIQGVAIGKTMNDTLLQHIASRYSYYPANLASIRLILNNSFIKNKYGHLDIKFLKDTSVISYEYGINLITHNLEIKLLEKATKNVVFEEKYKCKIPHSLPMGGGGNAYAQIDYKDLCMHFLSFENDTLEMIAYNTPSKYLKKSALSVISQNKIIEDLKQHSNDDEEKIITSLKGLDSKLRSKAIKHLENSTAASYFAKNDESAIIRLAACSLITDQGLLYEIAITDEDLKVKEEALKQLKSQKLIAGIVVNTDVCGLVYKAIEKLSDQEAITYTLTGEWKTDYCIDAKSELMKKAKDIEAIEYVLLNDKSAFVRQDALKYVSKQEVIEKIAKTPFTAFEFTQLRYQAILKLTDKKILKELKKDEDNYVRKYAKIRLSKL